MPVATQDHAGNGGSTVETIGNGLKTTFPARAVAITPNDSTVFDKPSAIYVGTGGTIVVVPASLDTPIAVTFNMQDGTVVPVMVIKVMVGGTASELVRVY